MYKDHPLFSMENIYKAYKQCRKRKRRTANAMEFERELEEGLIGLHRALISGRYRPGSSVAFLVEKPKRREIFAADFRDRVVHHILVGHLEPVWERKFIHDSYACRRDRGNHAGVDRLRAFTLRVTSNATRTAWYLQLDIKGYFIMIDKNILFERISKGINDPAVLWLLRLVIFHDPTKKCRLKNTRRSLFDTMPAHKTLFKAPRDCGLPIGNLSSQFFANVYLDALDQFVKHELKAQYYLRYCDDFVLLSNDREELEHWEIRIDAFLKERLKLLLNERRRLSKISDGIDFLGYIVRPDYVLVRRRVVSSLKDRLYDMEKTLKDLGMKEHEGHRVFIWRDDLINRMRQCINSYLAHFKKASSYRTIREIWLRYDWLNEYFKKVDWKVILVCPIPRYAFTLGRQVRYFLSRFSGHIIFIQVGSCWQIGPEKFMNVFDGLECFMRAGNRFHSRDIWLFIRALQNSMLPAVWIKETGGMTGIIAERALAFRCDNAASAAGDPVFKEKIFRDFLI